MSPWLPPELIDNCISFLPDQLAPYSTISKGWQVIVERRTFSTLHLNPTRLEDFTRIVAGQSRQRCPLVRCLQLDASLPEYSIEARTELESDEIRSQNNQAFSSTIRAFFNALSSWPEECPLSVTIYSRSPSDWTGAPDPGKRFSWSESFPDKDYLERRYEQSYLSLSVPMDELPFLNAVTHLYIRGTGRNFKPAVVSQVASRLPRLCGVEAELTDNEKRDSVLRDSVRTEFASSLAQWPSSVEHLILEYRGEAPLDGDFSPPVRSEVGRDALSLALNRITQQLATVDIRGMMVAPELFWPPDSTPQWSRLTRFTLDYSATTPSGQWLFEHDPRCAEHDDEDEWEDPDLIWPEPLLPAPQDYHPRPFRTKPARVLNELYLAAGRAAQRMPRLETFVLRGETHVGTPELYEIIEGAPAHWFQYRRDQGKATWAGSGKFELRDDVVEAWRAAARNHGHAELTVENAGFRMCPDTDDYEFVVAHEEEREREERGFQLWD